MLAERQRVDYISFVPVCRSVIDNKGIGENPVIKALHAARRLAAYPVKANKLTAAGTGLRENSCAIARAVSDKRYRVHANRRYHKLTVFPDRGLAAVFVYDLGNNMVFAQMHTLVRRTADRAAESHFAGAVMREKSAAEKLFRLRYDAFRAGIRADERPFQTASAAYAK